MADGQVVFEITGDDSKVTQTVKHVTQTIQTESKKWDQAADQSTQSMGTSFMDVAKKAAAAFSAAKVGQVLLEWGKAAVDAASDLAEVQNVVDVTFGDGAARIESWAKSAGSQFGLTETQAKKFTSTLGAMMKSAGMSGDEIVKMSTDLSGLAADMASFYNLDFETAFQKIRSGISGETEPLKQLGINMSVANLEAYALEKGITKAFNAMTQQEQTVLRYQYLMQATADAQGDFARTSDGFANATRKLQTNIDSITTALGTTFLGVVEGAVNGLNGFFELLIPDQSQRTVLDDFTDIDLKTDEKIRGVKETATEARLLADQLTAINTSAIGEVGAKVQKLATDLGSIDFSQDKAGVLNDFLGTLANNIDAVAAIKGTDADGAKEWMEGIAEAASSLDEGDAKGWADLLKSISEGLPGIENTDFGAKFFEALGDGFQSVGQQSTVLEWAVDTLGSKTNRTAQEQQLWLEVCQRLVQTIPGLSSIINTQTGEIRGGTQAVKDYIKAWEDGQVKLAMMGALEQKRTAVQERFADLPGLELDMAVARRRARLAKEAMDKAFAEMGGNEGYELYFSEGHVRTGDEEARYNAYMDASKAYREADAAAQKATSTYNTQKAALDEANASMEEYAATIEEMPGTIEEATEATQEWSTEQVNAVNAAATAYQSALAEMNAYVAQVRASTEQTVNSVIKGFNRITRPTNDLIEKRNELIAQQQQLDQSTKEGAKKYAELEEQINKLNKSMDEYSTKGMDAGLDSQLAFMDEYLTNLREAQEHGLSNELLASLSDGSAASAEYLSQLAQDWDKAAEIDEKFQQVNAKKEEFTNALTEQKLAADETYDAMVQKVTDAYQAMAAAASEGAQGINVSGDVETAMSANMEAMASAISNHTSEVATAVDGILAELNKLNNFGVHINLGAGGSIDFSLNLVDGSFATGLDWVPFDGFLAELHEGEGILTAEENRIWQRFKSGANSTQSMDYDTLGNVMHDNISPGGNVYLDGRVVGSVISKQQAQSYRALQRSGWQG